ncbi:hypothetical protein H4R34_004439 [Dimargaris verticillata]|uniref:DH domain-containing protein n=1 Tax=Dimargaris verticillata TaxID=2761393 RepID=A0A9W8B4B3_9FUNG|nr:hypothetical protein H4R34_004439 [Dimargaris verticillata]
MALGELTAKLLEQCGYRCHSEVHLTERPASLASLFPLSPSPSSPNDPGQTSSPRASYYDQTQPPSASLLYDHTSTNSAVQDVGQVEPDIPRFDNNTNGSVYSQLFWLNPLLPKDHLNFLGYFDTVGPICISVLHNRDAGWYHAFVRTPLKFSLVQIPVSRLRSAEAHQLLRYLPAKNPHKVILYYVLEAYFHQVDSDQRRYQSWVTRAELAEGSSDSLPQSFLDHTARTSNSLLQRVDTQDSDQTSPCPPPLEIPESIDSLTAMASSDGPSMVSITSSTAGSSTGAPSSIGTRRPSTTASTNAGSKSASLSRSENSEHTVQFNLPPRNSESTPVPSKLLVDMVLAIEPLNGESLKPALRNLEPQLIRRYHDVDIVVCVPTTDPASHLRFQRFLQLLGQPFNYQQLWATIPRTNVVPGASNTQTQSPDGIDTLEEILYRPTKARSLEDMAERRASIVKELIHTERSYVQKLQALVSVYVVPLRSASRSGKSHLIPTYMANAIFTNIEQVTAANEALLADLEKIDHENYVRDRAQRRHSKVGWADSASGSPVDDGLYSDPEMDGPQPPVHSVAQICLYHLDHFDVYKRYINGYQHALECSSQLEKKNDSYRHFLARGRDHPACQKLGLSDLLVMPVQRIPRYTLLLTDLLKNTPVNDPDHDLVQRALDRVHEIGQLAENQVADILTELHTIHGHVAECPASLISASRRLLVSIDATELDFSTSTILKHVTLYLFTDRIMIVERPPHITGSQSTSKKKVYKFLTWIDICSIEVFEATGPGSANRFFMQCIESPCLDPYWETKPLHAFSVSGTKDRQRWAQRFYAAHALRRSAIFNDDYTNPALTTGGPVAPSPSLDPQRRRHLLYRHFHRDEHQISFHVHFDLGTYVAAKRRSDLTLLYTDHTGPTTTDLANPNPVLQQFVDQMLLHPRGAHENPLMLGVIASQRGRLAMRMFNRASVPVHPSSPARTGSTGLPTASPAPPIPPPMRSSSLSHDSETDGTPQTSATVAAALARASRLFHPPPTNPKKSAKPATPTTANATLADTSSSITPPNALALAATLGNLSPVRTPRLVTSLTDLERALLDEVLLCKADLLISVAHLPCQQLYNRLFLESLFGLHLAPIQAYAYTAFTPLKRATTSQLAIASPGSFHYPPTCTTPGTQTSVHRAPSMGTITQPSTPSSTLSYPAAPHTGGPLGHATVIVNTMTPPNQTSSGLLRRARDWTSRLIRNKKSSSALNSHSSFAIAKDTGFRGPMASTANLPMPTSTSSSAVGPGLASLTEHASASVTQLPAFGHSANAVLPPRPNRPQPLHRPSFASVASTNDSDVTATGTAGNLSAPSDAGRVRGSVYSSNASATNSGPLSKLGITNHSFFAPLQGSSYFSVLGKYKVKSGTSRRNFSERRPQSMMVAPADPAASVTRPLQLGSLVSTPLSPRGPQPMSPFHVRSPAHLTPLGSPAISRPASPDRTPQRMRANTADTPSLPLPNINSSPLNLPTDLAGFDGSFSRALPGSPYQTRGRSFTTNDAGDMFFDRAYRASLPADAMGNPSNPTSPHITPPHSPVLAAKSIPDSHSDCLSDHTYENATQSSMLGLLSPDSTLSSRASRSHRSMSASAFLYKKALQELQRWDKAEEGELGAIHDDDSDDGGPYGTLSTLDTATATLDALDLTSSVSLRKPHDVWLKRLMSSSLAKAENAHGSVRHALPLGALVAAAHSPPARINPTSPSSRGPALTEASCLAMFSPHSDHREELDSSHETGPSLTVATSSSQHASPIATPTHMDAASSPDSPRWTVVNP